MQTPLTVRDTHENSSRQPCRIASRLVGPGLVGGDRRITLERLEGPFAPRQIREREIPRDHGTIPSSSIRSADDPRDLALPDDRTRRDHAARPAHGLRRRFAPRPRQPRRSGLEWREDPLREPRRGTRGPDDPRPSPTTGTRGVIRCKRWRRTSGSSPWTCEATIRVANPKGSRATRCLSCSATCWPCSITWVRRRLRWWDTIGVAQWPGSSRFITRTVRSGSSS